MSMFKRRSLPRVASCNHFSLSSLSAPLPTFAADDIVSVAVLDFQVGNIPYWWN